MSTVDNKALFRRWYEVISLNQLDRVAEFIAPDLVDHGAPRGVPAGPEGVKQILTMYRAAFPDLQIQIDDVIAEGDKVVGLITTRGTHRGEFMRIAPTGKSLTINAIDVLRFADGKIVEHWAQADNLALLQQLGTVPEPAQMDAVR